LFVLIALGIYPAYCYWNLFQFNRQRWSNSEFSPYQSSGDSDDDDDSDFDSSSDD